MLGGALGLAILASLAAARTTALGAAGVEAAEALNGGYHAAFLAGAGFSLAATLIGLGVARTAQAAELRPAVAHE